MLGGSPVIQIENVTITRTLYLSAETQLGYPATKVKVWFEGNGVSPYLIQSAELNQGSISVPVTVNGLGTYYVPVYGRWSDYVSTTGFTLPGNVDFNSTVSMEVPVIDNEPTIIGPVDLSGVGIEVEAGLALDFQFEGVNGESTWTERDQATSLFEAYPPEKSALDTAQFYNGTSSLKISSDFVGPGYFQLYAIEPFNIVNYIVRNYFRYDGSPPNVSWGLKGVTGAGLLGWQIDSGGFGFGWSPTTEYAYGSFYESNIPITYPSVNEWHKMEAFILGPSISIRIDDIEVFSFQNQSGTNLLQNLYNIMINGSTISTHCWIDCLQLEVLPDTIISEATSTFDITVSDNTKIDDIETITIAGDSRGNVVFTFSAIPTGVTNEIIIGSTAAITAVNVSNAIRSAYGGIFSSTATAEVVTVIAYSLDDLIVTTTSDGITIGTITKFISYSAPEFPGNIPSFIGHSFSSEHGALGDDYGLASVPTFTGASTCSQADFNIGRGFTKGFTGYADSFLPGCTISSVDADKIALMLYGNAWMQWLSGLITAAEDDDGIALDMTKWVANNITYTTDLSLYGVADHWADPRKTIYSGYGDCEDFAFLAASLMLNNGVDLSRVRVYMGELNGAGHAWLCYRRVSDEQWIILDATKG